MAGAHAAGALGIVVRGVAMPSNAQARAAFIKQAGLELGEAEDVLKHDLGRVLLKLEELQTARLQSALKKEEEAPALSDAEQAAVLDLLQGPDLLARILADSDA